MGDKFVRAVKKEYAPGIIGPFSLQSVITKDLEMIVYDVSLRVPGIQLLQQPVRIPNISMELHLELADVLQWKLNVQ